MKLKKISQAELDEILKQHQKWLDSDGHKGHQADLSSTDLSCVGLRDANLIDADLQYVDLRDADLHSATLWNANLYGANLQGADLQLAVLQYANLQDVDLSSANLSSANLQGANLQEAKLRHANLWGANLCSVDLRFADLQEAKLNWVRWYKAKNIKVYVASLPSSRENAQLTYIPSIDVATTGSWQGTWQAAIKRIHSVYADNARERKAYELAIKSIQAQIDLDD